MRLLIRIGIPLLTLIAGVLWGGYAYQKTKFPFDGSIPAIQSAVLRNTHARFQPRQRNKTDSQQGAQTALEDLGYMAGSEQASDEAGVVVHNEELAAGGLNLYVSGHDDVAILMDMDGQEVHRWTGSLSEVIPAEDARLLKDRFRKAHLAENGDLTVVYGGHAWLARYDKDSNLLWHTKGGYHHDLDVLPDGRIFAIGSKAHKLDRIHKKHPVIEDFICILDEAGKEVFSTSVLEAFENSDFAPMLGLMPAFGDITHTNSIEVLREIPEGAPESWQEGHVLISVREMDTIAVIDIATERVVWAMTGIWDGQHQAHLLANGKMLLFDNYGTGMSRIIEMDARTLAIEWDYQGNAENDFYSETCGSQQRLANGNTLITESDSGRAFEVTPNGTVVWRFVSPHRPENDASLVATLFEVWRYSDESLPFLSE